MGRGCRLSDPLSSPPASLCSILLRVSIRIRRCSSQPPSSAPPLPTTSRPWRAGPSVVGSLDGGGERIFEPTLRIGTGQRMDDRVVGRMETEDTLGNGGLRKGRLDVARPSTPSVVRLVALVLFLTLFSSCEARVGFGRGRWAGGKRSTSIGTWRRGLEGEQCTTLLHRAKDKCDHVRKNCLGEQEGIVDYLKFYYCDMRGMEPLAILFMGTVAIVSLCVLAIAADTYFCAAISFLAEWMGLSPNLAGIILVPIGAGAPDLFTYLVAFDEGETAMSFGAVFGSSGLISAFVMGCVVLVAGPIQVTAHNFVRNALALLCSVLLTLLVLLTGRIHVWYPCLSLILYTTYLTVALYMSQGRKDLHNNCTRDPHQLSPAVDKDDRPLLTENGILGEKSVASDNGTEDSEGSHRDVEGSNERDIVELKREWEAFGVVDEPTFIQAWQFYMHRFYNNLMGKPWISRIGDITLAPITLLMQISIPSSEAHNWNKFFALSNLIFSPLMALVLVGDVVHLGAPLLRVSGFTLPLFAGLLAQTCTVTIILSRRLSFIHPPSFQWYLSALAFWSSISWLSMAAEELMFCLASLGTISSIPGQILGATVIAWGNSVGDLVTNIALAKHGDGQMALAGCFASPVFNFLIGLGLPMLKRSIQMFPKPLHVTSGVPVLVSGSMVALTIAFILPAVCLSGFRFTKALAAFGILSYAFQLATNIALSVPM